MCPHVCVRVHRNCKPAVTLLKTTAERGPVGAMLQRGHEAFFKGWYQVALWEYLQAAAGGMELGMANAAWLLDQGYVRAGTYTCPHAHTHTHTHTHTPAHTHTHTHTHTHALT